jgi:hypothetical protein
VTLRRWLAELRTVAPEHLMMYWSGHGSEEGIVLADGLFTYAEFGAALASVPSRTRTFIADTCHAGAAWMPLIRTGGDDVGGIEEDWAAALAAAVPGLRLLAAVSGTALAHEDHNIGGGRYTYALLQALRCLPGDIVAPAGTVFISDVAAAVGAKEIIGERWPNDPLPELQGPAVRGRGLPLMRSQAERAIGKASVSHFGYPNPNTGVRAKLVIEVRDRRLVTTHVAWTAVDDDGRALARGQDVVDPGGNIERIERTLSVDPRVLLRHPAHGPLLNRGQLVGITWGVTVTDDHGHVLAEGSFPGAYYKKQPPAGARSPW